MALHPTMISRTSSSASSLRMRSWRQCRKLYDFYKLRLNFVTKPIRTDWQMLCIRGAAFSISFRTSGGRSEHHHFSLSERWFYCRRRCRAVGSVSAVEPRTEFGVTAFAKAERFRLGSRKSGVVCSGVVFARFWFAIVSNGLFVSSRCDDGVNFFIARLLFWIFFRHLFHGYLAPCLARAVRYGRIST